MGGDPDDDFAGTPFKHKYGAIRRCIAGTEMCGKQGGTDDGFAIILAGRHKNEHLDVEGMTAATIHQIAYSNTPIQTFTLSYDEDIESYSLVMYFATSKDYQQTMKNRHFTMMMEQVVDSLELDTCQVVGNPSESARIILGKNLGASYYKYVAGFIGHGGYMRHQWELIYFDGRGLAEVPRMIFALANMRPGHGFTDTRLSRKQFESMKQKGLLESNLNRVPILKHNGETIGQSPAIARYLAKKLGFFGKTEMDAARIDAICEHVRDIQAAWRKVMPYGAALSAEEKAAALDTWFDTPPTPELEGRAERQLEWYVAQLDRLVAQSGPFSVGKSYSVADVYVYNLLGEVAPELEAAGEPFGSLYRTTKALYKYQNVKLVIEEFSKHPSIELYLQHRVPSKF